ncbi:MAG: hypothetical protein ABJC63_09400 [Gemmatimonadales bacterium]
MSGSATLPPSSTKAHMWEMIGFEDRFYWTAPFGYDDTHLHEGETGVS